MKKIVIALGVIAVLVIAGIFLLYASLDTLVEKAIETVGPKVTQVAVTVDGVSIKPSAGEGTVKGLLVGNPPGYKSEYAMRVNTTKMAIDPQSLTSGKVVVRSIAIDAPEVNLEGGLRANNLTQIQSNILAFMASVSPAEQQGDSTTKLQVDELVITGAKVYANTGLPGVNPVTLTLPEMRLDKLGQGPEGITPAELASRVLQAVLNKAVASAGDSLGDLATQAASEAAKDAIKSIGEEANKALKGVTDIFKKKP